MTAPALTPVSSFPAMPGLTLSDDEQGLVARLQRQLRQAKPALLLRDAYYNGDQVMTDLGISLPPELRGLRAVMGWPRLAVDALHERMDVQGFRFPDVPDADTDMWDIWQANNLDSEAPMGMLDGFVFGRSFVVVGSRDNDLPLITVESPLNMTVLWSPSRRLVTAAFQEYLTDDGAVEASLYLPDQTITLSHDSAGWVVDERDDHRLGEVPVLRMANRQRTHQRAGASEITTEVMSITDAGCRTLLGVEVAREFYAAPQRYILGATQEAFQAADGTPKSAWETYVGRVLALERDETGELPTVGQFTPYDPSVYANVVNMYAEIMASITGLPASYLGKSTDNPASADAIRMSTDRLVQRVRRRQTAFEETWEAAMRLALAFRDGQVPDQARRIETIWRNPEIPTPAATTDAVTKQIASGYLPATSDVAGEVLGYTPLQRSRIDAERRRQDGRDAASQIVAAARGAQPAGPVNDQPAG